MKKFIFALAICIGIVGLCSFFAGRNASGQRKRDNIQYNAVYDCPAFNDSKGVSGGRKFKVLRCDGNNCKVFSINEYNPNGGFELDMTKAAVIEDISRYRCIAQGNNQNANTQTETEEQEQKPNGEKEKPNETTVMVACPASDADSKGKTALEKAFRGAVRESWEKEAEEGLDGAITITFQSFVIGSPRQYRVFEDPTDAKGKSIYPVRATFTTCTNYNRRIETVKREREISCYKNTAGKYACTIIAAANTNVKDKTKSIDKPMQ